MIGAPDPASAQNAVVMPPRSQVMANPSAARKSACSLEDANSSQATSGLAHRVSAMSVNRRWFRSSHSMTSCLLCIAVLLAGLGQV